MTHVLLGGRGLLGSGFATVLGRQPIEMRRLSPPWSEPAAAAAALSDGIVASVLDEGPTTVVWAAGVGSIGAVTAALAAETAGVHALADAVRRLPTRRAASLRIVFASSAGALYGGHGDEQVDDGSPPIPVTPYGREKLVQEDLLRRLVDDAGCTVVSCRFSNLYGLAQGRVVARGLVSTAVRATRLRTPMTVFVSPDTRRDYVYNNDAAAVALLALQRAPAGFSTRLVCDGTTRTVVEVLALVGRVSGRRVPATYGDRPETRLQPRVLRFSRPAQGPGEVRRTPMEAAVHRMLRAPLAV